MTSPPRTTPVQADTDNITTTTTGLDISGCAEADSTVEILKGGASFSTKVTDTADTTDASCTGGTKKFSASISLSASATAYSITAKATDSGGQHLFRLNRPEHHR